MEKNITKRYCEKCGKEMLFSVFIDHYDVDTGKPIEYIKYICLDIEHKQQDMNFPASWGTFFGHSVYYYNIDTNVPVRR